MQRLVDETTRWVADKLSAMPEVHEAAVIGSNVLGITRKKHQPFAAGILSVPTVTGEILQALLDSDSRIAIVANIPKESVWRGDAIALASARGVAFGSLADLMSATGREENVRGYQRREYEFVERGLRQHNRVLELEREFDRIYLIHRRGLPALRFVMLNEYELTADHIRTARSRYGRFDAVLLNNPNGKPTANAVEVAKSIGADIYKWGPFLGRLNRI